MFGLSLPSWSVTIYRIKNYVRFVFTFLVRYDLPHKKLCSVCLYPQLFVRPQIQCLIDPCLSCFILAIILYVLLLWYLQTFLVTGGGIIHQRVMALLVQSHGFISDVDMFAN